MALYTYPQPMYRSDGLVTTCNCDGDVANLVNTPGQNWSSTPWSPSNYNTSNAQTDYDALAASNEALAAQVQALLAEVNAANAALTSTGL